MKILGIITARGGSKRVPRKNIKEFLGKPLLAWSIEIGKEADVFDRFILTTEDKEIAEIGKKYGIEVPFMRPKEFALDTSKSFDAIRHAVEWLKESDNFYPDWIILLEPTSPGRRPFHIREIVEIIKNNQGKIDSIIGISKLPSHYHPLKVLKMENGGLVKRQTGKLIRETEIRNQDFPELYYSNSAIYAFRTGNLFGENPNLWGNKTLGYLMDEKYSMDIDTLEDWLMAEIKMRKLIDN